MRFIHLCIYIYDIVLIPFCFTLFAEFANRKCELNGQWGSRPNDTYNPNGWTDYQPCYKPEVNELMQQVPNLDVRGHLCIIQLKISRLK